jgi:Ser/Thr protein kinase RdoA (MazF antagonist)
MPTDSHLFTRLTPDLVMDAVESVGFRCDARILELNSYENRVYQIGIEDETPIIGKFYRPDRWTDAQILEEHNFTLELAAMDVSAVPPIKLGDTTLDHHDAPGEVAGLPTWIFSKTWKYSAVTSDAFTR